MLDKNTLRLVLADVRQDRFDLYADALIATCQEFNIDTALRQAPFLSNLAHESGNFSRMTENLNYSAEGLLKVFPKYFTADIAASYARDPERIASRVYANRMGNGDEASREGWKYRGRGPIQLTGKSNYTKCGEALGLDLVTNPEILEQPLHAVRSSGWFWSVNNINKFADTKDFDGVCDVINRGRKTAPEGDSIGYADRLKHYQHACEVLLAG